jgi:IS5 family transposase
MRQSHTTQPSIFDFYPEHDYGRELKAISLWLDDHSELIDWVRMDLTTICKNNAGRSSMTAESVLRCALLKQIRQLSYQDLAFALLDSQSCQTFGRLDRSKEIPGKSALQKTISRISAVTWEVFNQSLVQDAKALKLEKGDVVRIDSTVTESDIHEPTDSTLLWDSVRTLVRLMEAAEEISTQKLPWVNHQRSAKKRMHEILNTKGMARKVPLYKHLLRLTKNSLDYIETVQASLLEGCTDVFAYDVWLCEVQHFVPLIKQVVSQTERRVLNGESVPATEKLYSIFEPHTDLIKKGSRPLEYGHKLNLSSGKSGLILDLVVEQGNPCDTSRLLPMLQRHKDNYGQVPRQCSVDGGYASQDNLDEAKAFGVKDMAFSKKKGLTIEAMASSQWIYKKLQHFRAGIESNISCLKRAYGMTRCLWKGWERFNQYVWLSVVSYNLSLFARLRLKAAA